MSKKKTLKFEEKDGKIIVHEEANLKRRRNEFHAELMRMSKASIHVDRKKKASKYAARGKVEY